MKTKKTVFITLLALCIALLMGCAPSTAAATVPQTDTPVLHTLSNNVLTSNTEPEIAAQENDDSSTPSAHTTAACGICGKQNCSGGVHCGNRNDHHNSGNHHSGHNRHHH